MTSDVDADFEMMMLMMFSVHVHSVGPAQQPLRSKCVPNVPGFNIAVLFLALV